jgi:hypothetical protein
MNKRSLAGEQYKLLYFGRHGEGEHNVAEAKYGTEAWDVSRFIGYDNELWANLAISAIGRN